MGVRPQTQQLISMNVVAILMKMSQEGFVLSIICTGCCNELRCMAVLVD